MKKQLLIFTLALLVSGFSSTVFAQRATQLIPRVIDCLPANDALHPIAGTPYDYEITVPTPAAWTTTGESWTGLQYHWFVTQDGAFYDAGAFDPDAVLDGTFFNVFEDFATGFSEYNIAYNGDNTTNKLRITWQGGGYDPSLPIFVGISVTGTITNGEITGCSPNNLKIWKIVPQWAFTLDIDNLNGDGTAHTFDAFGDNLDNCISPIISADYDPSTPDGVIYDFGQNVLYYDVIAANWYDRWQLGVMLNNLDANQTATIHWAYPIYDATVTTKLDMAAMAAPAIWHPVATAGIVANTLVSNDLIAPQANGATSIGQAGENIIIRVTVDHGNLYEGLNDLPLTLVVDGIVAPESTTTPGNYVVGDAAKVGDVHWTGDGGSPVVCPWYDSYSILAGHDLSVQTIKARPTITPVNPGTFLPLH